MENMAMPISTEVIKEEDVDNVVAELDEEYGKNRKSDWMTIRDTLGNCTGGDVMTALYIVKSKENVLDERIMKVVNRLLKFNETHNTYDNCLYGELSWPKDCPITPMPSEKMAEYKAEADKVNPNSWLNSHRYGQRRTLYMTPCNVVSSDPKEQDLIDEINEAYNEKEVDVRYVNWCLFYIAKNGGEYARRAFNLLKYNRKHQGCFVDLDCDFLDGDTVDYTYNPWKKPKNMTVKMWLTSLMEKINYGCNIGRIEDGKLVLIRHPYTKELSKRWKQFFDIASVYQVIKNECPTNLDPIPYDEQVKMGIA